MNVNVNIDWRFVIALGSAAALIIFSRRLDSAAAEHVLTHAVSTVREFAIADRSNH